ncbi:MAG: TrkA family potassium uptake protein, partial [Proteobacteria bacterium]|nr:TrkA family potassium uptake protein [Pseudomonadota bacterium]
MRRFAVIGLGKFGMALAEELTRLGQQVTAIDADPDKAREAQAFVHQAYVADATRRTSLVSMGLAEVDVGVVSLGEKMDRASLGVLHLSELGVPHIAAKALNQEHASMLARMGAHQVVFPEREMAFRLAERLGSQHVLSYVPLRSGFAVLEVAAPAAWTGRGRGRPAPGRAFGVQVLAVRELVPERTIVSPRPDQVVKDSDALVVLGPDAAIDRVRRLDVQRRQFAVIGLGRFGYHLVRNLYEMGHDVLAVDDREETVQQIGPFCSQAVVADASDEAQMKDVG